MISYVSGLKSYVLSSELIRLLCWEDVAAALSLLHRELMDVNFMVHYFKEYFIIGLRQKAVRKYVAAAYFILFCALALIILPLYFWYGLFFWISKTTNKTQHFSILYLAATKKNYFQKEWQHS